MSGPIVTERDSASVTFITPTLNPSIESLIVTFDSIGALRAAGLAIEHIVIDGGSDEPVREFLDASAATKVLSEPGANISESLNAGWRAATGDFVCVMNAGDAPLPGVVDALRKLVTSRADVGLFAVQARHGVATEPKWRGSVLRSTWIHAGMLARVELVHSVGEYGRRFQFAMDWDWLSRAERRGKSIAVFPGTPPITEMEPFGLSRARTMSSAGEFLDVVRRDCPRRTSRVVILVRHAPYWLRSFLGLGVST